MASKTSGFNSYNNKGAPKYINDFSKALASEVRILLAEVGKLRDERRALQFEIAELMSVKSKHGAGGEYAPDWRPRVPEEAPLEPEGPPEDPPEIPPAKPAWRTVHKRPERKPRSVKSARTVKEATPAPTPKIIPESPKPELPAWATWRPNPLVMPTPRMASASNPMNMNTPPAMSHPAGLFGPSTPPPK